MRDFLWMLAGGFGILGTLHVFAPVSNQLAYGMERDIGYGVALLVVSFAAGLIAKFRYGDDDE